MRICYYSLIDEKFLNFRPSTIAACSIILAHNISKNKNLVDSGEIKINTIDTKIWQDPTIIL